MIDHGTAWGTPWMSPTEKGGGVCEENVARIENNPEQACVTIKLAPEPAYDLKTAS